MLIYLSQTGDGQFTHLLNAVRQRKSIPPGTTNTSSRHYCNLSLREFSEKCNATKCFAVMKVKEKIDVAEASFTLEV